MPKKNPHSELVPINLHVEQSISATKKQENLIGSFQKSPSRAQALARDQYLTKSEKDAKLQNFYKEAYQLFLIEDKKEKDFVHGCLLVLEEKVALAIGDRKCHPIRPYYVITDWPNQSGFHTQFPEPLNNEYDEETLGEMLHQRYILIRVINDFLSPHGINTKGTVCYRGFIDIKVANQSVSEGNMFCDEGGYTDPSFIPHGSFSHLIQTYISASFYAASQFQREKIGFSFLEFMQFLVGSYDGTNTFWLFLLDHVLNSRENAIKNDRKHPGLMDYLRTYHHSQSKLTDNVNNFTSSYFVTNFLLKNGYVFPMLHRMVVLDAFALLKAYQDRFNERPETTKKFIARLGTLKAVDPIQIPGTFKLKETADLLKVMLFKYGPPTEEDYMRTYTEYTELFPETPEIIRLDDHLVNPSREVIDRWFPNTDKADIDDKITTSKVGEFFLTLKATLNTEAYAEALRFFQGFPRQPMIVSLKLNSDFNTLDRHHRDAKYMCTAYKGPFRPIEGRTVTGSKLYIRRPRFFSASSQDVTHLRITKVEAHRDDDIQEKLSASR